MPADCLLGGGALQAKLSGPATPSSAARAPGPRPPHPGQLGRPGHLRGDPPDRRRPGRRHRQGGLRVRPRLRPRAGPVRQADRRPAGHRLQAGRHGHRDRRRPAPGLARSWMARNGMGFSHAEGSMSKLKAGEVATRVTDEAIQILGGYGFIRDFPVEKWHRDAKIYTLFEGTSEIQRGDLAGQRRHGLGTRDLHRSHRRGIGCRPVNSRGGGMGRGRAVPGRDLLLGRPGDERRRRGEGVLRGVVRGSSTTCPRGSRGPTRPAG